MARITCSQCREPRLIPDQGTRFHMSQLRVCMPQLRIPYATTKIKELVLQPRPQRAKYNKNKYTFLKPILILHQKRKLFFKIVHLYNMRF